MIVWTDPLDLAAHLRAERESFVLATVVARDRPQSVPLGARAVVRADGSVTGWVGGGCVRPTVVDEALKALRDGQARLVRIGVQAEGDPPPGVKIYPMTCHGGGRVEVYVEPVLPMSRLLVFGVTPVARALVELAPSVGFEVWALDPRADAATFPAARIEGSLEAGTALLGSDTFVVVATQGEGDEEALRVAVQGPSAYVGFVASRKKGRTVLALMEGEGVERGRLETVRYPAGLDLGGMAPAEIALSILAEMVAVRAGAGPVSVTRSATGSSEGSTAASGQGRSGAAAPAAPSGMAMGGGLPIHPIHDAPQAEAPSPGFATDPVCGMAVEIAGARYLTEHDGGRVYFCCPMCQAAFEKNPSAYTGAGAG